jgi:hypothetical protein
MSKAKSALRNIRLSMHLMVAISAQERFVGVLTRYLPGLGEFT